MSPNAVLYDEPTSSLDPEIVREVLDVMIELAEEGMVMLCVTHKVEFIKKVADQVMLRDAGEVFEKINLMNFLIICN